MTYHEVWYRSDDGLKLHARDYANANAPLTLLCLHGLSRNSAGFGDLAAELQDECRIVAVDQRGRGRSAWDADSANYTPARYVSDILDEACFAEMQRRHPHLTPVTVPEVGHAPMLDEPGVVDHVRAFLGRIHAA